MVVVGHGVGGFDLVRIERDIFLPAVVNSVITKAYKIIPCLYPCAVLSLVLAQSLIANSFCGWVCDVEIKLADVSAIPCRILFPRAKEIALNVHVCPRFRSIKHIEITIRTMIYSNQLSAFVPYFAVHHGRFSRIHNHFFKPLRRLRVAFKPRRNGLVSRVFLCFAQKLNEVITATVALFDRPQVVGIHLNPGQPESRGIRHRALRPLLPRHIR